MTCAMTEECTRHDLTDVITSDHSLPILLQTHRQTASYASEHTATITGYACMHAALCGIMQSYDQYLIFSSCSAVLFSSFGYLVLSFKDGSISVRRNLKKSLVGVGFEPTPSKWLVP